MAKPRAKTMMERQGFKDPDLKNAKHDDLMVWLYEHTYVVLEWLFPAFRGEWGPSSLRSVEKYKTETEEHIRDVISEKERDIQKWKRWIAEKQLNSKDGDFSVSHARDIENYQQYIQEAQKEITTAQNWETVSVPTCKRARISNKELEKPISDRNYIIGYIDMVVEVDYPVLELENRALGGRRLFFKPKLSCEMFNERFYFEVKTKISNLGELLRQINTYRKYEGKNSTWIVFAPDDAYRSILKEQNIYLVTPGDVGMKREEEPNE